VRDGLRGEKLFANLGASCRRARGVFGFLAPARLAPAHRTPPGGGYHSRRTGSGTSGSFRSRRTSNNMRWPRFTPCKYLR